MTTSTSQQFPSLESVNRPAVDTTAAAYYLNRRPQTLRAWACRSGTGPIEPRRINGRLEWSVAEIKILMGVAYAARRDLCRDAFAPNADTLEGCKMKKIPNRANSSGTFGEQLSFLPPPPFFPIRQTRGTLANRALGTQMDGKKIDHSHFEKITRSWRLSAAIFTLRTLGRVIALYRLSEYCIKQFCSTF